MLDADAEELFYELIDLSPENRTVRLRELERAGTDLHAAVSRLLRAHDASSDFLMPRAPADHPERLGKYVVEEVAGRGAAGIVYVARDPDLGRSVAIKTLAPGRLRGVSREALRDEARVLATVVHPNVAQVYSIEEVAGDDGAARTILTMELVPGATLAGRLRDGALSLEQAIDIGRQIAAALEAAHARSIVHRDLKPQNVCITPEGWVKVLDFGLAFLVSGATGVPTGGTPGYMSPEQCRGESVDLRTDIWALGSVLFECLAGLPALPGETLAELFDANRRGAVRTELPREVPDRLARLVREMLAPDPSRRLTSAADARRAMEEELLRLRAGALAAALDGPHRSTTGAVRGNLPSPISSFVGRGAFLEMLTARVAGHRVVSITGPGGAGKTRTSIEAAGRMQPDFPGGTWFVDLTTVNADAEVGATVARTLGVRDPAEEAGPGAAARAVASLLHGERALVVLDNCEHVLAGAARFVGEIAALPEAPRMLATSRQPLGVAGEEVVPLPPLDLPVDDAGGASGRASEAVALFIDRTRSRVPGFAPDTRALGLVGELCRRLDGLPLAIELAASYTRALPLEDILHRATDRSLTSVLPSDTGRHRSLHDLVNWSYRLLPVKEQLLLRRLSVFRGGWTLAVAESVCGGWGDVEAWEVCDLLARLVERSLVEPETSSPARAARYRLLETIRVFAGERVAEVGDERRRVEARYLETVVEHVAPHPRELGPTRSDWAKRIEPEYPNALNALEVALTHGRHDLAFELAEYVSYLWVLKGLLREGDRWMRRLLPLGASRGGGASNGGGGSSDGGSSGAGSNAAEVTPPSRAQEVRVLSRASLISAVLWNAGEVRARSREALRLARLEGDAVSLGHAHTAVGLERWKSGDLDAAATAYDEAYGHFAGSGHWGWAAVPLANRGIVEGSRGDVEAAMRYFSEYIELARTMGNGHAEGRMLLNVGALQTAAGALEEARDALERAIEILEAADDQPGAAQARQNLGQTLLAVGELPRARRELVRSYEARRRMGDRVGAASCVLYLGHVARREGRDAAAAEVVGALLRSDEESVPWDPRSRAEAQKLMEELAERMGAEAHDEAAGRGAGKPMHALFELARGDG